MTAFPAVEAYRRELRRLGYRPMDDAELAAARHRFAEAHHSNAIEGVRPGDEQAAFWAMLFEERVPEDLQDRFAERFLEERILAPARERGLADPPPGRAATGRRRA